MSEPLDGVAARLNAERLVVFGWSRAILLQLAHPLIAAGVAEHSAFRSSPLHAAHRLHHTVRAMLALTFGDSAAQAHTLETIRGIHRRVNGVLPEQVGRFGAGTPYSAEDPALLLWVHATLLDSIPAVYERLVSPLTPEQLDAYCAEAAPTAIALGARDADTPRTWAALRAYVEGTLESGVLAVGSQARALASAVLRPPLAPLVWPMARVNRLLTVGLLPADVRDQYGFTWTGEDDRRLQRACRVLAGIRRRAPGRVALWADARRA